ncbi:SEC-C metal-binding domain-containing protein [Desulfoferrobacter suflitae]|uniref:SEC-C metal-binding domain-containing protein n=1 Tax=Desulfoferrobacter suflitae TaxID=2865782 RepID=UPI0021643182|nr:SEC-C metal-binding domain-containing protein [Desulfoferrobacter suflitae]MCK8600109.1 SEC-C metal-binding domain-containing protein [Desulfoferrobacter suflitae]
MIEEVSEKASYLLQPGAARSAAAGARRARCYVWQRFFNKGVALPMSKISRNAPCPCGSGKKYK